MISDLSLTMLVVTAVALLFGLIVLSRFVLPKSYYERQTIREEQLKEKIKQEYSPPVPDQELSEDDE